MPNANEKQALPNDRGNILNDENALMFLGNKVFCEAQPSQSAVLTGDSMKAV
jgi:hypothetical protein